MSMIDVESPQNGQLTDCYRNEFLRHTRTLPEHLVQRLRQTPALLVREQCCMTLGERAVNLTIETVLEQCLPWVWRIHGQHLGPCEHVDPARLAIWTRKRTTPMGDPSGPRMTPVLALIAHALHEGVEGRDWRMLRRLPIVRAASTTRNAA